MCCKLSLLLISRWCTRYNFITDLQIRGWYFNKEDLETYQAQLPTGPIRREDLQFAPARQYTLPPLFGGFTHFEETRTYVSL